MIRAVGIILVIALLTIPPAIAGEFSRGLKGMMGFSVVLGIIFTTAGLYLSYLFDLPSEPRLFCSRVYSGPAYEKVDT